MLLSLASNPSARCPGRVCSCAINAVVLLQLFKHHLPPNFHRIPYEIDRLKQRDSLITNQVRLLLQSSGVIQSLFINPGCEVGIGRTTLWDRSVSVKCLVYFQFFILVRRRAELEAVRSTQVLDMNIRVRFGLESQ